MANVRRVTNQTGPNKTATRRKSHGMETEHHICVGMGVRSAMKRIV
jgi:hypothetical protein